MIDLSIKSILVAISFAPVFVCYAYRNRVGETGKALMLGFLFAYLYGGGYFVVPWIASLTIIQASVSVMMFLVFVVPVYLGVKHISGRHGS